MTWQERITQVLERLREPDAAFTDQHDGQVDLPYFKNLYVEYHLRTVGLELLREVPVDDLQAIGSEAVKEYSDFVTTLGGMSFLPIPLGILRVVGCRIDGKPAVQTDIANFFQRLPGGSRTSNCFTFFGTCVFIGTEINLTIVEEPSLDDFRTNAPILPSGKDMEWIDRTIKRMMIEDFEPPGRA